MREGVSSDFFQSTRVYHGKGGGRHGNSHRESDSRQAWWQEQEAGRAHFHPHTGSRGMREKERIGSWLRLQNLKAHPSDVLPPGRIYLLKVS